MAQYQVKVSLNEDIRRVSVNKNITFEELTILIRKLFNLGKDVIKIEYQDEEKNDWIVTSTDLELEEAKRTTAHKVNNMLRLRVNANITKVNNPNLETGVCELVKQVCKSVPAIQAYLPFITQFIRDVQTEKYHRHHRHHDKPAVHKTVQCDGCGTHPIVGMRYKCKICPDFDFCGDCYGKVKHDASHEFLEISRPLKYKHCHKQQCCNGEQTCNEDKPLEQNSESKVSATTTKMTNLAPPEPKLNATFVEDVTIADQTEVQPGTPFTKIWKMKNVGTIPFPDGTRLGFIGGDALDGPALNGLPIPKIAVGEEFEIELNLVAPDKAGRCIGHWKLMDPSGTPFGHRIWVDIIVPLVQPTFVPLVQSTFVPLVQPTFVPLVQSTFVPSKEELKPLEVAINPIVEKEDSIEETASEKSEDEDYVKVEDSKPVEVPKPAEAPRTVEVPKPIEVQPPVIEALKPIEVPKPVEIKVPEVQVPVEIIPSKVESPKPIEAVKPVEVPKPIEVQPPVIDVPKAEVKPPVIQEVKPMDKKDAPKAENINWTAALTQLSEMGFREVKTNIVLLKKHRGDIEKVISELVANKA